jgi:type IV pilus assembly protein PilX
MNRTMRFKLQHTLPAKQRGMVLLVSLVFLLLLTLLGISSMQNATLQEKMSGSVALRNQTFQRSEAALRLGESSIKVTGYTLAKCTNCLPPAESATLTAAGVGASGVSWLAAAGGGFYGIQNLGTTATPISRPPTCTGTVTLYRVTSVAIQGTSRTVLESIYANC